MFLHKAAAGGYAEVQFGQLAVQKGSSDEVKKFGQKMVDDHTALNDQMKPFLDAAGLQPPTKLSPKDQAEYDKLNGLSGDAFDKEYLASMVKDHHEDLREFRKEQSTTADASLKDAVTKGTAVIRDHTEMVDKLAKDKGVPVPVHHGAAATPAAE
jgi:putative membrane protein